MTSPVSTDVKLREVRPGVHRVHLPLPVRPSIVNVTLVDCGGGDWVLIDTGMASAESVAAMKDALAIVGCAPGRLRAIVCTHYHPDHFGASRPLREATGAPVFLHPLDASRTGFYTRKVRSPEALAFFERQGMPTHFFDKLPTPAEVFAGTYDGVVPDHALADGDRLVFGERELEIVWTPGHTPGHCVVFFRRERVLVVGDHLLPKITPHVGIAWEEPIDPLGDFLASLRKVGALDVETVLPAHGPVFHDHRGRVKQLLEFHDYRLEAMLDAVRTRARTTYEVALETFGLSQESPFQQQFPATFETLAHLEHLRRGGRVERTEGDGKVRWRA